ncbi:TetR/AcrR family transcriptional regulator [Tsuneonella mangrovi]|uniref:TetR/AcrR family transcriptional regulator n=1 Tax=Tsuneonella mangrovi TaxID=1982042 RepID=UPI000BA27EC3|nr:TetR/AcrR family transcriptional regulator [Tsuneonella mangrovi]
MNSIDLSHGDERARLVAVAERLVEERGEAVSIGQVASAAGVPRARVEAHFAEDIELVDAILEEWYADHIKIMEEVLATDLPPKRKMFEFYVRRFRLTRSRYRENPAAFETKCELGANHFTRVESYVDLADHYLCELIAQAQADGAFPGLQIDEALSLINQMVHVYTMPETLVYLDDRLSEAKLATIVDTLFDGLSGEDRGAAGVTRISAA